MRKLGNVFSGLFLVLVFIASISFSYFNTTEVSISLGSIEFSPLPVSVWIIGAFVSGGTLGLLLGLGLVKQLKSRAEIRRLNKKLTESQQEVSQLRSMTLKDLE
ncbi:MAG: lipopolysaccharide assembly protein LapA domain-containing protein [Pseudomonadales bacterium]|nr:lipopolysaccharide assembly protein LapA domain-containing protein [Pseudomonadales bacterium]